MHRCYQKDTKDPQTLEIRLSNYIRHLFLNIYPILSLNVTEPLSHMISTKVTAAMTIFKANDPYRLVVIIVVT